MLLEPSRASSAARRSPAAVLTAPVALRRPRQPRPRQRERAVAVAVAVPPAIRNGALAAGSVLTLTGRGDLWTCAIAFGVADASLLTGVAVAAAAVATLARTGSAGLTDVAGAQAVLGAAGFTGTTAAIAASWTSAVSLVGIARTRVVGAGLGLVAGALVAGPSPNGGLKSVVTWLAGAVGGAALGLALTPRRGARPWQRYVALGFAAAGVALGVYAGYH